MISAFGPYAARYDAKLQACGMGNLDAVIGDFDSLLSAHADLLSRRYEGRSTYGMILTRDVRWQAIMDYTPILLEEFRHDYDLQCAALSKFGAGTLSINDGAATSSALWDDTRDETARTVISEFCQLSDAALRAFVCGIRAARTLMKRLRTVEVIVAEPKLPVFERRRPPSARASSSGRTASPRRLPTTPLGCANFFMARSLVLRPPVPCRRD